ncbi:hypothetical protein L2X98_30930 [Microbacterium elymi]|uniref:Uncharacterized protein n=1 Tax=Microbacterium elymi TaxID=2909587 RepID=A0ABY5NI29_9MICO|nr:hypothetical protein [Microbacterium elymi]UUT34842.1 hypothetical protein L2X98_30930 [Microbacterium elymi]
MSRDVRQSFANDGDHVVGDSPGERQIDGAGEGDARRPPERRSQFTDHIENAIAGEARSPGCGSRAEGEDRRSDLSDRRIEFGDVRIEPCCGGGLGGCQRLKAESCGEQTLDDVIVQVPGDATALVDDLELLSVSARPRKRESDSRLVRELLDGVEFGTCERSARIVARDAQGTDRTPAGIERNGSARTEHGPSIAAYPMLRVLICERPGHDLTRLDRSCAESRGGGDEDAGEPGRSGSLRRSDTPVIDVDRDHDGHQLGGHHPGEPLGDQCENVFGAGIQECRADLRQGLAQPLVTPSLLIQPRVLDGHPGRSGERLDERLVFVGERPVHLVGEIEVAEHGVAHADGDGEE